MRAATVYPSRLFPALDAGYIARGRSADLVLLDANPLDDIRNTRRIRAVLLRGSLLNRDALDRIRRDAAALAARN